jgi:perosamine synthetase
VPTSFEPGAPVAQGEIPLCVPSISGNAWAYVRECLDTGWVSSVGSYVTRFERMVAEEAGSPAAVATSTGTAALHVALQVAGVAAGDEVLVSSLTFIAPANSIRYLGAWPVFIDAEPRHWQMDVARVEEFLRGCTRGADGLRNPATGRRVKALLPVHVLGHPVDLDPLLALAREFDLPVIEDATESLGARYKGGSTGSRGDIGCFSFNGNKIITTGGGGMIVTGREEWARRARHLTTQAKKDPVEYVHEEVGYNYRLTNLQAALGCAQMEQLAAHVAAKRRIAELYTEGLRGLEGVTVMAEAAWARSTFWLYTVLLDEAKAGLGSRSLLRGLAERGIQTRPLWQPLHQSRAFEGSVSPACPVAERLNREALSLPCSVGLTESEQERVIESVIALVRR